MKYSHKLSDGVHILAYIAIFAGGDLSSRAIATSIEANPSLVRRLMAQLVKSGLLLSQPGAVAPALARPAQEISLLDIYRALAGGQLLHVDEETNPQCPVGGNIQATLDGVYAKVQTAAEQEMAGISLQTIVTELKARAAG